MKDHNKNLAKYRLESARENLESAELLTNHGKYGSSLNRSYYAMLNSIRALLALAEKDAKTHKGTIELLNRYYIAPGHVPKTILSKVTVAEQRRNKGDYEDYITQPNQKHSTNCKMLNK
jgi:uncharacterized protein (UPF0332 family)